MLTFLYHRAGYCFCAKELIGPQNSEISTSLEWFHLRFVDTSLNLGAFNKMVVGGTDFTRLIIGGDDTSGAPYLSSGEQESSLS